MLAVLWQRNFALFWFGGLISMMGDWMLATTLPIYVYQQTGSTLATSAAIVSGLLPGLFLGSVAGVFVDRWNRKRTMIISNVLLAVTLLPLLMVRSAEALWLVYVVSFVQASIALFFSPAEHAVLPSLVRAEHLIIANALNALNNNLARLLGPPLGGIVGTYIGLPGVVLVDGVSFLIAGGMIACVSIAGTSSLSYNTADDALPVAAWARVWREWLSGLWIIRRSQSLATLFGIQALLSFGEGLSSVMFVVWVNRLLGGGALEIGWLQAAQAVGGLLGGLVIGRLRNQFVPIELLGPSYVCVGVGTLLLFHYPQFVSGLWLGVAILIIAGIPSMGAVTGVTTLLQRSTEDAYRGRVFAAHRTTGALLRLLGTMIAGAIGNVVGPIMLLTIHGCTQVLAGAVAMLLLSGEASQHKVELKEM